MLDPEWAVVLVTLVGSLATTGSLVFAMFIFIRNENRKRIDAIRVDAESARGLFDRIDRSISPEMFMQASEEFRGRLNQIIGPDKSQERFVQFLRLEKVEININRLISQSINAIRAADDIDQKVQLLRESTVRIGQVFPVSSYVLIKCMQNLERALHLWRGGKIYIDNVTPEFVKNQASEIEKSKDSFEILVEDFSSLIDYMPLKMLEGGVQDNINDTRIIVDRICENIAHGEIADLRAMSSHEKSVDREGFEDNQYSYECIQAALESIRAHLTHSQWDAAWAAVARMGSQARRHQ
mgnify:CR=1 FL=1